MSEIEGIGERVKLARKWVNVLLREFSKYKKAREKINEEPVALKKTLQKFEETTMKALKEITELQNLFFPFFNNEKEALQQAEKDYQFKFIRHLESTFSRGGLQLSGQLPTLRAGPYQINVDFIFKKVSISFGPEPIKTLPLVSNEVTTFILNHYTNLRKRLFPPENFISILYNGYKRAIKLSNKQGGERVAVLEVLREIVFLIQNERFLADPQRQNYTPFSRLQFALQLAQLRRRGILHHENMEMVLVEAPFDATFKRHRFIWVPEDEEGGGTRFSHLFFRNISPEKKPGGLNE